MAGLFKNLFGGRGKADDSFVFRVRCSRCGSEVDVRVNPRYDLQPDYDSPDGGYVLNKEIQDDNCFRIMKLSARFDQARRLTGTDLANGEILAPSKD